MDGIERELQLLLADHPDHIEQGLTTVTREFRTDIGPVDILCRDRDGRSVAVEIKRIGEIDGVEQLTRYLERMQRDPELAPVRGSSLRPASSRRRACSRSREGIGWVEVDVALLRGEEEIAPRLFAL
jgi:endonuclease